MSKSWTFPHPVAERLMWQSSDEDLVLQRILYPMDLGKMLWRKRLARRSFKRMGQFVVESKAKRMMHRLENELQQTDMTALMQQVTQTIATMPMPTLDMINNLTHDNMDQRALENVGATMSSAIENWEAGNADFGQVLTQIFQPQFIQNLFGALFAPPPAQPLPNEVNQLMTGAVGALEAQIGPIPPQTLHTAMNIINQLVSAEQPPNPDQTTD